VLLFRLRKAYIYSQNWRYISFPNKCFLVTACILTQNRKCSLQLYWRVTYFHWYDCNVVYIFISGANLSRPAQESHFCTPPALKFPMIYASNFTHICKNRWPFKGFAPKPHQELCPWTPLGDFRPLDPLMAPPVHKIMHTPLDNVGLQTAQYKYLLWKPTTFTNCHIGPYKLSLSWITFITLIVN